MTAVAYIGFTKLLAVLFLFCLMERQKFVIIYSTKVFENVETFSEYDKESCGGAVGLTLAW